MRDGERKREKKNRRVLNIYFCLLSLFQEKKRERKKLPVKESQDRAEAERGDAEFRKKARKERKKARKERKSREES